MNKRQTLTTILSVLLSVFLVVGVVMATTTIGLDIANDSTSEAFGINLSGAYTTAALQIGTSGDKLLFAADDDHAIDVWTTNAQTSGTVTSVDISQTHTGAGALAEALKVTLTSDVKTGAWANAIMAKLDFSTDGYVWGMAAPICAELNMPGSLLTHGTYAVFEAELGIPANSVGYASNPTSFIHLNAWGDNVASWRSSGYIFYIAGVGDAAGVFQSQDQANPQIDATMKIRVDNAIYYIPLCDNADCS